jgi:pSer/pThr/pTyr-binding forkhead associated (FHA) protein
VRCSRCGKDNPESLRFCQDCGNRLVTGGSAGAAPAPPRGLASNAETAAPIAPPAPAVAGSPLAAAPAWFAPPPTFLVPALQGTIAPRPAEAQRPAAPPLDFGGRPAERVCPRCGTANPVAGRFCSNCGRSLELPPEPITAPQPGRAETSLPGSSERPDRTALALAQPSPIAPAPPTVTCQRCHAANSTQMSFCQFCGARLVSGPDDSRRAGNPLVQRLGAAPATATQQHFSAEPALNARLVVIGQDGKPGREYSISEDQTDIGREEGGIVLPNDPYVAARHARLTRRNGRFFVRDLESVNGVYVRLRGPERLQHADLVLVGLEVLRFEVVSDAEKWLSPAVERGTQIFGSPSAPRHMRLCQRTVEGVTRDVYYPTRDEAVVGREQGDIVFTNDPFMSRRHAAITRDPSNGTFSLRDLGSSNGTYMAIRSERELSPGDLVRIGQHLFRLDVGRVDGR